VSRIVRVESVQTPHWSTRAIAWGFDVNDGYHVAFTLSLERGRDLAAEIEAAGEAFYRVEDGDILFAKPPTEPTEPT
jgi:hypothetical protein